MKHQAEDVLHVQEKIRKFRTARNLTIKQLSEISGVSERQIRRIEKMQVRSKSETLLKLLKHVQPNVEPEITVNEVRELPNRAEDVFDVIVEFVSNIMNGIMELRNKIFKK